MSVKTPKAPKAAAAPAPPSLSTKSKTTPVPPKKKDSPPAPNTPADDPKYYVWYRRDGLPFPYPNATHKFHLVQKSLSKPKHATQEVPQGKQGVKPGQSAKAKVAGPIPTRSVDDARVGAASTNSTGQRGQRNVVSGSLPKNPPPQLEPAKRSGYPAAGSKRDADSDQSEGGSDMQVSEQQS